MRKIILGLLVQNIGKFVSGEEMSRIAGISRAAIWKHIDALKKEGYTIESVTKKGYRLIDGPEKLESAFFLLPESCRIGREHVYLEEVGSTNSHARTIADRLADGAVILADRQTAGKGRMGRQWDSPPASGIWMSIVLKPAIQMREAILMTHMAGAAVCEALCSLGFDAAIKWPNDIVIRGKKVCGILAELDGEPDMLRHVIVGIGVNVNQLEEDFPAELLDRATSLRIDSGKMQDRAQILLALIGRLDYYYSCIIEQRQEAIIDYCRQHSATLGREIRATRGSEAFEGKAVALTAEGGLIVENRSGQTVEIISGEVSVRGIYGYI